MNNAVSGQKILVYQFGMVKQGLLSLYIDRWVDKDG